MLYKVKISQVIGNQIVGETVLTEDFDNVWSAIRMANKHSSVYDAPVFQIREYDECRGNIISFDSQDTGRVVEECNYGWIHFYPTTAIRKEGVA